jgi:hypothetical protein
MLTQRYRRIITILGSGAAILLASLCYPHALPSTQDLHGEVLSEKNVPLPEAVCTLTGSLLPEEGLTATTDRKGQFEFSGLEPGEYTLFCGAAGYQPLERTVEVADTPPPLYQIILPPEVVIHQKVEVHEQAPTISTEQAAPPPATLNTPELRNLPLVEQKFKAALPYIPGVVRTPDGKINIKGVPENQGMLLVNSAETSDPVTGSFSIDVPVVALDSLQVYKNAYNAQYGGFSGGLTTVHLRPPSDDWHFEFQNIPPNPRIENGTVVGIADFNPILYVTGPLIASRLNFSETFAYDIDKNPVRGLAFPNNDIKIHDVNSVTEFQYVFSPRHLATVSVNVFPLRRQFANINSLVPQTASSDYGQKGFSVNVMDQDVTAAGGVFTTLVHAMQFDSNGHGQGALDMLVTPNGWGGNFFNTYHRSSNQEEGQETYRFPERQWLGKHELTLGGSLLHRSYTGSSDSRPVLILRPDQTLAEKIDFGGPAALQANDFEGAFFVADHWVPSDPIALDWGVRYSGQSLGSRANVAPRLGIAYSPGRQGKTVLRAGVGLFYDHSQLLAGDFLHNPTRSVSFFDESGALQGPPIVYQNLYGHLLEPGLLSGSLNPLDSVPHNWSWSLEADRELRPNVVLRVSYISSRTYSQFIVNPSTDLAAGPALLLTDQGASRYQELESTVHYRRSESSEWNFSYVYSVARGDLNTLAEIYVPFEQPVIRPNAYANLPSDTPQRAVTWGRFKTHVWGISAGPVIDLHSGLPYAPLDVLQDYVGQPNSVRFPHFFSVDLKLSKEFHLPLPWLRNHVMRGEFTTFNLTNHANPRDVYNNTASPFFDHFAGNQHRFFDTGLDVIY